MQLDETMAGLRALAGAPRRYHVLRLQQGLDELVLFPETFHMIWEDHQRQQIPREGISSPKVYETAVPGVPLKDRVSVVYKIGELQINDLMSQDTVVVTDSFLDRIEKEIVYPWLKELTALSKRPALLETTVDTPEYMTRMGYTQIGSCRDPQDFLNGNWDTISPFVVGTRGKQGIIIWEPPSEDLGVPTLGGA